MADRRFANTEEGEVQGGLRGVDNRWEYGQEGGTLHSLDEILGLRPPFRNPLHGDLRRDRLWVRLRRNDESGGRPDHDFYPDLPLSGAGCHDLEDAVQVCGKETPMKPVGWGNLLL